MPCGLDPSCDSHSSKGPWLPPSHILTSSPTPDYDPTRWFVKLARLLLDRKSICESNIFDIVTHLLAVIHFDGVLILPEVDNICNLMRTRMTRKMLMLRQEWNYSESSSMKNSKLIRLTVPLLHIVPQESQNQACLARRLFLFCCLLIAWLSIIFLRTATEQQQ